jgi:hypothetical protein
MRASLVFAVATFAVVLSGHTREEAGAAMVDRHAIGHQAEVRRIQAHFDSVLSELQRRDVSQLSASQRTERTKLIGLLASYRERGVFPHNRHFPGEAIPYFIDRPTGTLCAVAHLLESTGRRDIVDAVAAMDNNVWVAELEGNRPFEVWLERHGLTLAEAARIQVPYVDDGVVPDPNFSTRFSTRNSSIVIGSATALTAWNIFANRNGQQGIASIAGMAVGAAAMGYGGALMATGDAPRGIGAASIAVGGISALLATRGFFKQRHLAAEARKAQSVAERTTVTPIVPVSGQNGAGLSLSIRF